MKTMNIEINDNNYDDPYITEEALLARQNEIKNTQVISKLLNGKIRLYKIVDYNDTDYCNGEPFETIRTIELDGTYRDIKPYKINNKRIVNTFTGWIRRIINV
jgi:hypothetical protein